MLKKRRVNPSQSCLFRRLFSSTLSIQVGQSRLSSTVPVCRGLFFQVSVASNDPASLLSVYNGVSLETKLSLTTVTPPNAPPMFSYGWMVTIRH
ncbi:hypothetical protein TNCV_1568541 [Trichonephila clavipes]|nr:hypothetical protein TNCV_1568541 [Trichonephila clavipes]